MLLLKHQIASKRREARNVEALGRLRERGQQKDAIIRRAAAFREATDQLDRERDQIAWDMREEQAQAQVQNLLIEREARTCLKVAKNRTRSARAQERMRMIRRDKLHERREMEVCVQSKHEIAAINMARQEEQKELLRVAEEQRRELAHADVLHRKQSLEALQQLHVEHEFDVAEQKRNASIEWVYQHREESQAQMIEANKDKFIRQRENLQEIQLLEAEQPKILEAYLQDAQDAAECRRMQKAIEVKATFDARADAREVETENCRVRKEILYRDAYNAKVEDVEIKEQLHRASVEKVRIEAEERIEEKARLKDEQLYAVKLRKEEELMDAKLLAVAEMEEAGLEMERQGISVNLLGLRIEAPDSPLAIENSLLMHENRARRLADRYMAGGHLDDANAAAALADEESDREVESKVL